MSAVELAATLGLVAVVAGVIVAADWLVMFGWPW